VAGADGATPPEVADDFEKKLTAARVPHERHVYAGAPHSFFDRGYEQWKDASDDAWRRILDFVKKHS
jgi:carboxymethylenebutenolidase